MDLLDILPIVLWNIIYDYTQEPRLFKLLDAFIPKIVALYQQVLLTPNNAEEFVGQSSAVQRLIVTEQDLGHAASLLFTLWKVYFKDVIFCSIDWFSCGHNYRILKNSEKAKILNGIEISEPGFAPSRINDIIHQFLNDISSLVEWLKSDWDLVEDVSKMIPQLKLDRFFVSTCFSQPKQRFLWHRKARMREEDTLWRIISTSNKHGKNIYCSGYSQKGALRDLRFGWFEKYIYMSEPKLQSKKRKNHECS